jgi:hypothetical protein
LGQPRAAALFWDGVGVIKNVKNANYREEKSLMFVKICIFASQKRPEVRVANGCKE